MFIPAKKWSAAIDANPQHTSRIEFTCGMCDRESVKFSYMAGSMFFVCRHCPWVNLLEEKNCHGTHNTNCKITSPAPLS